MTDPGNHADILRSSTLVAFDTETTGIWAPAHRLVEIGAVKFSLAESDISTFQALINPGRPIPAEVIEIHGITDDMVATAPAAATVLEQFEQFCGPDAILIAHNATFDLSFLACEYDRLEREFGDNVFLDTIDIYQRVFPGLPSYSLLSLSQHFHLAESQDHRALADAQLVYQLMLKAADQLPAVATVDELELALAAYRVAGWHQEQRELPEEYVDFQRAIADQVRMEILYHTPTKPAHNRIVRPIAVYSLGARFYLNAFCERAGAERTFRLDRVESWKELP